ncbi:MAG: tetratricopeptide repeat protein [Planctomycetota bacterium]
MIIVLVWVAAVHLTCLSGTYVFDDISILRNEALADALSFRWFKIASRPLGQATFALQFSILGRSEEASHAVNLAIHLIALVGFFRLVERIACYVPSVNSLLEARLLAGACSLLWGVHPLTTNVVSYVVQRYESLASLFIIWSLCFWLKAFSAESQFVDTAKQEDSRHTPFFAAAAVACALAAMASKEIAAGLPIVLATAFWVFPKKRPTHPRLVYGSIGLLCLPVMYGFYRRVPGLLRSGTEASTIGFRLPGIDAWEYIASQPLVYGRYLKLFVLPTDLVLDYGWLPLTFDGWHWLGLAGWILIVLVLLILWYKIPMLGFALSFILLVLATTSLVPTQDLIFEHRFYLPTAILIVSVGAVAWTRLKTYPAVSAGCVILAAVLLSAGTLRRNADYTSVAALSSSDLKRQPHNPRTIARLAAENSRSSLELEAAMRESFEISRKRGYFYKGSDYFWSRSIADLLFFRNEFSEAATWYRRALSYGFRVEQKAEVLLSLGVVSSLVGEREEADRYFEEALSLDSSITPRIREAYKEHRRRADQP